MADKRRDGRKMRRDIVMAREDFDISSRNYQRLIAKIEGKPEERILSYLMLRSLKQARYSNDNDGHFALAAPAYTHFTSPIRRYPDLIVHRVLAHQLATGQPLLEDRYCMSWVPTLRSRSAAPRRPSASWWSGKKSSSWRTASATNSTRSSSAPPSTDSSWSSTDLFVEGLVPIETLPGDRFRYHENGRKIIGERSRKMFSIGDRVRVRLDRADTVERKLQFAVVEYAGKEGRRQKRR